MLVVSFFRRSYHYRVVVNFRSIPPSLLQTPWQQSVSRTENSPQLSAAFDRQNIHYSGNYAPYGLAPAHLPPGRAAPVGGVVRMGHTKGHPRPHRRRRRKADRRALASLHQKEPVRFKKAKKNEKVSC